MSQHPYTHQVLKVVVAQICQTIGWHAIHTFPLELMVDILDKYIKELARSTHRYSELYNRSDPNLDDLGLAFKDLGINLTELKEYIEFVDPVPCAVEVPKYPVAKDSHLNFLKPGSKEVLTRPMHVYEHLPPIHPEEEEKPIEGLDISGDGSLDGQLLSASDENASQPLFKKPSDPSAPHEMSLIKRPRPFEEEGRPTREISSVMMTTSGFISPAREGKLPDSRPPIIPPEPKKSPPHVSASSTALLVGSLDGKFDKKVKREKKVDKEKKVEKGKKIEKVNKEVKQEKSVPPVATPLPPPLPKPQALLSPLLSSPIVSSPSPAATITTPPQMPPLSSTPKIEGEKHQNFHGLIPQLQPPVTPIKKSPKKREKKKLAQLMDGSTTAHPMEPKPKKQKLSKKQLQQQLFQQQMLQQTPNHPPTLPPQIMGGHNYMDLLAGKSMALNSQTSIMPVPGPSMSSMMQQFGNSFPPHRQSSQSIELSPMPQKLTTEPDKQKLNIFKKMAKPTKDDVIIIDDDDIPLPKTPPNQMTKTAKMKLPKTPLIDISQPLNMSMNSKGNSFNSFSGESFSMNDFSPPKTPLQLPKTPDIKMSSSPWMPPSGDHGFPPPMHHQMVPIEPVKKKERKPKVPKEKKVKQTMPSNWDMNSPFGQFTPEQNAANLTKFLTQSINPMMQAGNPAANLLNMLQFAGPGLIPPGPSLLPQMPGLQAMQRGGIPGFGTMPPSMGMSALDFLRLPMKKPQDYHNESSSPPPKKSKMEMAKPMCNVAPLIPPSLKIDDSPNKAAFLETATFMATPKQKPFIPEEPKVVHRPPSSTIVSSAPSPPLPPPPIAHAPPPTPPHLPIKPVAPPQDDFEIIEPVYREEPKMPPKIEETYKPVEPLPPPPQQLPPLPIKPQEPIQQVMVLDEPPSTPEFNSDNVEKRKKDKEHKKDKKDKEGKVKKKKDKKDKNKSKERERDEMGYDIPKKDKKKDKSEKERLKKEKKERKKERERQAAAAAAMMSEGSNIFSVNSESKDHSDSSVGSVPRLTLKLGSTSSGSPRPDTPDACRKLTPNPFKHDEHSQGMSPASQQHTPTMDPHQPLDISIHPRDPSPELARISALVTRPPKQKGCPPKSKKEEEIKTTAPGGSASIPANSTPLSPTIEHIKEQIPPILSVSEPIIPPSTDPTLLSGMPHTLITAPPSLTVDPNAQTNILASATPGRGRPRIHPIGSAAPGGSAISPISSNTTTTATVATAATPSTTPLDPSKVKSSSSTHSSKPPKESKSNKTNLTSMKDAQGNEVWICPACGHLDDGTPMIGCDGCDAWYHWVCVGIQVPPGENEDWYCRVCITKKQESHGEKKKKRKKKDKKEH